MKNSINNIDSHPVLIKTRALQRQHSNAVIQSMMERLRANPEAERVVLSESIQHQPYYERKWVVE